MSMSLPPDTLAALHGFLHGSLLTALHSGDSLYTLGFQTGKRYTRRWVHTQEVDELAEY